MCFHCKHFCALTLEHFLDRNTGPARDDAGNMFIHYGFWQRFSVARFFRFF